MKIVCNMFAGPSGGKSTAASELYVELKKNHIECELISEFAKQLILEGNHSGIQNQLYLLGNQLHRQMCAYSHTDVVITDSPILLCAIYRQEDSRFLKDISIEQHNKFNNLNILLKRGDGYTHSMSGRIHSIVESIGIDKKIKSLLIENNIKFMEHDNFTHGISDIASLVMNILKEKSNDR